MPQIEVPTPVYELLEYDLPPRDSGPWFAKPRRYHHGDLFNSAIRRGLEIVERHGPDALTLRGLARDLKVSAQALLYHFGSRMGLRNAVAAWVGRGLADTIPPRGSVSEPIRRVRDTARAWLGIAGRAPNLYRAAFGESWLPSTRPEQGWYSLYFGYEPPTASVRRRTPDMFRWGERTGHVRPPAGRPAGKPGTATSSEQKRAAIPGGLGGTPETRSRAADIACCVAAALHGLAFARVEGVPEDQVHRALEVLLDALGGPGAAATTA